jgi:hypothetical protein
MTLVLADVLEAEQAQRLARVFRRDAGHDRDDPVGPVVETLEVETSHSSVGMLGSSKPNGARIRPSTSGGPRQNFGSPTVILTGTPCAASHVAYLPVTIRVERSSSSSGFT